METEEIKELLHIWEVNNGVPEEYLTDLNNAAIEEVDSNKEATMYKVSGNDADFGYYCTTVIVYDSDDLFALSDWQSGYPESMEEIEEYGRWLHHTGREGIMLNGMPRLLF